MFLRLTTSSISLFLLLVITVCITGSAEANNAPTPVGTIDAQTLNVGGTAATVDVSGNFSDPDGDTLTYTAASDDTAIATVSVSSATATLTPAAAGTATITVTATDPDGLTAEQTISVTVIQPNRAPILVGTIPNQTFTGAGVRNKIRFNARQYFSDPDGDPLQFASASNSNGRVIQINTYGNWDVDVIPRAGGTATVSITARDPSWATATLTFSVTVIQPNRAPTAFWPFSDKTLNVYEDALTSYVANHFIDPDGDILTHAATSGDDSIATVSMSTNAYLTITPVAAGTTTITITAIDPEGLTVEQTFSVTVIQPNRAPIRVGTIPNQTLYVGRDSAVIDVSSNFRDPDGDTLTYTATSADEDTATVSVSDATLTLTPVAVGNTTITVTVTDPEGLTAEQTFSVTVIQPNRSPVAVGTISDKTLNVYEDALTSYVANHFIDPDGDTLTHAATSGDDSIATVSMSDTTLTITPVAAGTTTITITAIDPDGINRRTELLRYGDPDPTEHPPSHKQFPITHSENKRNSNPSL